MYLLSITFTPYITLKAVEKFVLKDAVNVNFCKVAKHN